MATSAAKFAFGDNSSNTEPLSGAKGDVSRGEPFDAGNLDAEDQERIRQSINSREAGNAGSSDAAYTTSTGNEQLNSPPGGYDVSKDQNTGPITTATNVRDDSGFTHPTHDMSAPGRKTSDQDIPGGVTTSTNRTTESGFTSPGQDMGGARNPPNKNIDDARSPSNQGLGGTRTDSSSFNPPGASAATPASNSASSGAANGGSSSELREDESHENGTGEQYVKSSGLKADGGDFDATKPGAGREADRLLEAKGVNPTGQAAKTSSGGTGGDAAGASKSPKSTGSEEKHGLIGKIKEKLHKN